MSTFYNVYGNLRSLETSPATLLPLQWGNEMKGDTFGVELWGNYQLLDWRRLAFGFNQQYENLSFQSGSSRLLGIEQAGDDPGHQASLRSSMTLGSGWTLDADLRYVGSLPEPAVPAYEELDVHVGWQISRQWQVSVSGFNLLRTHHVEFTVPPSDAIGRSVLGQRPHQAMRGSVRPVTSHIASAHAASQATVYADASVRMCLAAPSAAAAGI